jgi:hypothetical protein
MFLLKAQQDTMKTRQAGEKKKLSKGGFFLAFRKNLEEEDTCCEASSEKPWTGGPRLLPGPPCSAIMVETNYQWPALTNEKTIPPDSLAAVDNSTGHDLPAPRHLVWRIDSAAAVVAGVPPELPRRRGCQRPLSAAAL